jgi:hypothetical protein
LLPAENQHADIQLAERFPNGIIGRNDDPFPPRLNLFCAVQSGVVEIEIFVHEIFREPAAAALTRCQRR